MRKLLFVLFVISINTCYAQKREGTITIDNSSYGVYTAPDSYGGTNLILRSNANALTAPQVPIEIPQAFSTPDAYWDEGVTHFIDSLAVNNKGRGLWYLMNGASKYESRYDPDYRKLIIFLCKEQGLIRKTYIE